MESAELVSAGGDDGISATVVGEGHEQEAGGEDPAANGHELTVSSAEKGGMSEELKDIFNKLIDDQGHLDMRNVTTLIWVNRKKPEIVETIVELLIENSNERRVFNGIEFYLPQLAHMIIHLDVDLRSSALEQFALVVCQQSLHVALQLNWILVAALEDYHAELPDGSRNKKANAMYFHRCAKLLQNVERIIALGAPSAAGLEELYATGKLSKHEMESRTIAQRRKQAEKVICSPHRGSVPVAEEGRIKGWLWHKRWHKRGFPHTSRWIRRWFEVEDRVLYCYSSQDLEGQRVKRAAVLYQASVVVCDYKDGRYPHYFEVHSPMGNMRLRADDAAAKEAWISSLQKQARATPSVAHFYSQDGHSSVTAAASRDPSGEVGLSGNLLSEAGSEIMAEKTAQVVGERRERGTSASTLAQMEAKRNKRFRFFNDERKFVSDLTDICETLRFVEDRSQRGNVLETLLGGVQVPDCAFLPLCRSTDAFQRVLRITPQEAKAFSTKERVPVMMTLELEQTWLPGTTTKTAPPLDVASYLHFVYGSYAPMNQNQRRYSSVALSEDAIMEPDLLTVGDRDGDDAAPAGIRHSRSGSFQFRSGSKRLTFPHVPMLPGGFPTVWREKTPGAAKDARAAKSPFRHNLSSLSSALQARASSIRNVKLSGVLHSVSKRSVSGSINTPGSASASAQQAHAAAAGADAEEKSAEPSSAAAGTGTGTSATATATADSSQKERRGYGHSVSMGSSKNVAWEDGGDEEEKFMIANGDAGESVAGAPDPATSVAVPGAKRSLGGEAEGGAQAGVRVEQRPQDDGVVVVLEDSATLDKVLDVPTTLHEIDLRDRSDVPWSSMEGNGEDEGVNECMTKAYGETMAKKAARIRRQSVEGARDGWTLERLIVKSNDDVRQEVFIMQLITFYKEVFEREGLDLYLKPYSILSTAKTTGLIQFLNQSTSIDGLKKSDGYAGSIRDHFLAAYGPEDGPRFKKAQRNFLCSLAGYSVVCYLLRIKDRHNGNVMLDSEGHLVHIDFGFVLGIAPGKQFSMERPAFKFTAEYVALLGGKGSELYEEFVDLFTRGLLAARKYASVTVTMIEIMMFQSEFKCFGYMGDGALKEFKRRLMIGMKDSDIRRRARYMVENAENHWGTRFYDRFQLWSNGIAP